MHQFLMKLRFVLMLLKQGGSGKTTVSKPSCGFTELRKIKPLCTSEVLHFIMFSSGDQYRISLPCASAKIEWNIINCNYKMQTRETETLFSCL